GRVDADQVALLKTTWERDRRRADVERRTLELKQAEFDRGELAAADLVRARLAVTKVEHDLKLSRLKWERKASYVDPAEVAALELRQRELHLELGTAGRGVEEATTGSNADNDELAVEGIARRIAALRSRIESERAKNKAALERARKHHREALRDAYDLTPINFVEFVDPDSQEVVRRVAFGAAVLPGDGATSTWPPPEFEADTGGVFDAARGYGWDRDLTGSFVHRDGVEDPRHAGAALVRDRAAWRCALPDGRYRLRLGVGDDRDWHGPLIRVVENDAAAGRRERAVLTRAELKTWEVAEDEIEVAGGSATLVVGDDLDKAMRAPHDGVARPQPWLQWGHRVGWTSWPIAYFSNPDSFRIKALVRQDLVSLLIAAPPEAADDAGETPAGEQADADAPDAPDERASVAEELATVRVDAARVSVATSEVMIEMQAGARIAGQVHQIGTTPVRITRGASVWWWGDEKKGKDLIAREVLITPDPEKVSDLRLGESVRCTVTIEPGPDMCPLPAHLVKARRHRAFVQRAEDGALQEIEGFRVGRTFVVTDWRAAAAAAPTSEPPFPLVAPWRAGTDEQAQRPRFPGELVAGSSVEVGIPRYWGRIKELVDDGSEVENGELIITLYSPTLEGQREQIKEQKKKAQEEYLVAVENRRLETIDAQLEHDRKVIEEGRARSKLHALGEHDPIELAAARLAHQRSRREAEIERSNYEKYRGLEQVAPGQIETARIAAGKAMLRSDKAHVFRIAAERRDDWMEILSARQVWMESVDALSLREVSLRIIRKQEQVARLAAEMKLQRAMEGGRRERQFNRIKDIHAPVSGRLFYLTGWNDHARARTRITKDFPVWGGLPIAQILDMSALGMKAELPEKVYGRVEKGSLVTVGFDQFPGVRVSATVETVGDSFFVPADHSELDFGEQAVSMRRVFTIKAVFAPPPTLRDRLMPGGRGYVMLETD
ncbi:MAG: hypothetical protein CMJ18_18225, partial [Phycisphaeraceae bacterium]|nr:hypothetical protein [Phycisphaeraceae bacterium]